MGVGWGGVAGWSGRQGAGPLPALIRKKKEEKKKKKKRKSPRATANFKVASEPSPSCSSEMGWRGCGERGDRETPSQQRRRTDANHKNKKQKKDDLFICFTEDHIIWSWSASSRKKKKEKEEAVMPSGPSLRCNIWLSAVSTGQATFFPPLLFAGLGVWGRAGAGRGAQKHSREEMHCGRSSKSCTLSFEFDVRA